MSRRSRFRHCGKVQMAIYRAMQAAGAPSQHEYGDLP
jgi:hypothetical protein